MARPANGASAGELRLRDLGTGVERTLAPAAETPRRPAVAGDVVAWEATLSGKTVVRVSATGGASGASSVKTISGPFDHAGEPKVADDAVVFTAWLGADDRSDTDVVLHQPSTGMVTAVAMGPGQQRFADVSATHVAWSDFAEDPDGVFDDAAEDAADIAVLDRPTAMTAGRRRAGKQAFPLLGADGKFAYLDFGEVHPEPKFSEYDLRLGEVAGPVDADVTVDHIVTQQPYVRPVARGALLQWITTSDDGTPSLLQRGMELVSPAEEVGGFAGLTVFGPSTGEAITLVGASAPGAPVTLRAFSR